jgi:hypothetical protein
MLRRATRRAISSANGNSTLGAKYRSWAAGIALGEIWPKRVTG